MGIYSIKPMFQRALRPLVRAAVGLGVSANALTWAGLGFSGLVGIGLWLGRDGGVALLLVPIGALLRTAANALDGLVAAATGTAHPRGELFNETADRVGDVVALLPALWIPGVPPQLVGFTVAAAVVASFIGVAVKAAGGPRVYRGVMAKPDRMFVIGVGAAVAFAVDDHVGVLEVVYWIMLAGVLLTIALRLLEARRALP